MLVVCTGTGTEIGKTWVGAQVLSQLKAEGVTVAARKPVQSYDAGDTGPTDADVLAMATGEHPQDVCPGHRWYRIAMAPPMAAALLEADVFTVRDLIDEIQWPSPTPAVRWVETVGGVRSPIAFDGDSVDLCDALEPDLVVLVGDGALGTINSIRLSANALRAHPVLVVLNRWGYGGDVESLNRAWLTDRDGFDVVVSPHAVVERLRGAVGGHR